MTKRSSDRKQLTLYFIITFAVSWLLWMPGVLRSNGMDDLPEIVGLPGMFAVFGPAIAAFFMVHREQGSAGMGRLFRRAFDTGFDKRWLAPTLFLVPLVGLLTLALLSMAGKSVDSWSPPSIVSVLVTPLMILFVGGGLEEFGWRGYALDRLQSGRSAVSASLILGFIWGLWHLPLFFIEGTVQASIPIWQFILQQMVLAVFYTWLYNNSSGSLLVSILFHTIGNSTSALLPPFFGTEFGRWTNFVLLAAAALAVVLIWGWRSLNHDQPVPQPSR